MITCCCSPISLRNGMKCWKTFFRNTESLSVFQKNSSPMITPLKKLLTVGLLICQFQAFTQTVPKIEREQWNTSTTVQKPADKYKNESAVILLDKRRIEFIDEKEE